MKRVAERAEVSLSTVYNLFASKEDVLAHVFNEAFAAFQSSVLARASVDPLHRFLDVVDIAAELYVADEPFYRSSIWLVDADSTYKMSLQRPRFGFFRDLVVRAIAGGVLRPGTDAYVVGLMVVPMFSAPYQAWAGGWVSIDEFRARTKLGFCIVLKGYSTEACQQRFDALVARFEEEVRRHGDARAGRARPT